LENPPGLYIHYVRENIAPPADFCSTRKAKLQGHAQEIKDAQRIPDIRLEIPYEEYRSAEIRRFTDSLTAEEYQELFEKERRVNRRKFRSMTTEQLDDLTHRTIRVELESSGRVNLLSFDDFCRNHSVSV